MINSSQKDRVIAVLTKHGLTEQRMARGMYSKEGGITVDLTGKEPIIGMMILGKVQAEGNSNREIDDIQREVAAIMKKSNDKFKSPAIDLSASPKENAEGSNPASGGISNAPELKKDDVMNGAIPGESKLGAGDTKSKEYTLRHPPGDTVEPLDKEKLKEALGKIDTIMANKLVEEHKKGTTTAICPICNCIITGTIEFFRDVQDKYGAIYCSNCGEVREKHETKTPQVSADKKVAGNVPATPAKPEAKPAVIRTCKVCGNELAGARALECYQKEKPFTCEECEGKHDETKHQEKKEGKDEATKEREARPEEPKVKEKVMSDTTGFNLLDYLKSYVNNDVLEIFGDSGTGKSKFAVEVARQTIASGKTVFYLDTERNLSKEEVEKLTGCNYKYTPLISEISTITRQLPKVDLVIVDSIGFPILTAYARMNMKQKGDALLNMIAIFGDLKEWAYRNNSIAIVINQPESDFNKAPDHLIRPFGDKSQFAAKEIWKTEVTQRGAVTKSDIRAFRSRSVGHKTLIAKMEVSDNGTDIKSVVK